MKPGVHSIDIVPFTAKNGNPFADDGELYYERTYWTYRRVGPDEKDYVCSSKTFGESDYIQEYRQKESRNPNADPDYLKSLEPKERQLFFVYERSHPEKGLQLLEMSYHTFGKLLDSRIKNSPEERGWDLFYFPDDEGFTLEITVSESSGGMYKFNEVTAIDFIARRNPLPEDIVNHGHCLDDFLVKTPYEKLRLAFMGISEDSKEAEDEKQPERESRDTASFKQEKEDQEDVYLKGKRAALSNKGRDSNPYDSDTESYKSWKLGWLEGKEESLEKKETKKEALPTMKVKEDQKVLYKGEVHTVLRILEGGSAVNLLTKDDDIEKNVPVSELSEYVEKKEEKKSKPKAEKKEDPPFEPESKEEPESSGNNLDGDWDDWD